MNRATVFSAVGGFSPHRCLSEANKCDGKPVYRFTWPDQPEAYACKVCAQRAQVAAATLGFELKIDPHSQRELPDYTDTHDGQTEPSACPPLDDEGFPF